jgi:hypothetical protein
MNNRVVAHYQDGHLVKGFTNDFLPAKDRFHLFRAEEEPGSKPVEIRVAELKALFFVKSFEGDPNHQDVVVAPEGRINGRRIRVVFQDGEVLEGITQGYDRNRPGFFVVPSDPGGNNERCFVVTTAAREVTLP